MRKVINIKNQIAELEHVEQLIEEICEELGLSMEMQMNLNLVLEEMVSNIIFYAYPKGTDAHIELVERTNLYAVRSGEGIRPNDERRF